MFEGMAGHGWYMCIAAPFCLRIPLSMRVSYLNSGRLYAEARAVTETLCGSTASTAEQGYPLKPLKHGHVMNIVKVANVDRFNVNCKTPVPNDASLWSEICISAQGSDQTTFRVL